MGLFYSAGIVQYCCWGSLREDTLHTFGVSLAHLATHFSRIVSYHMQSFLIKARWFGQNTNFPRFILCGLQPQPFSDTRTRSRKLVCSHIKSCLSKPTRETCSAMTYTYLLVIGQVFNEAIPRTCPCIRREDVLGHLVNLRNRRNFKRARIFIQRALKG